jgi:16S rRNA (cytosine967-C5)-methyltransferase
VGLIAERGVALAERAMESVLGNRRPFDALAAVRRSRRGETPLAWPDAWALAEAIASLFRWWGWIEPLGPMPTAQRLAMGVLMDAPQTTPLARAWARTVGLEADRLLAVGDAPTWTARSDGFKRLAGTRTANVDPWRLFPEWFRAQVLAPPGGEPPKVRLLRLIEELQRPGGLWVRVQGPTAERVWDQLRELGLRPWVHRRLGMAARLEPGTDLTHLGPTERGALEPHDLADQVVAPACAPVPGQRWWVTHAGDGQAAIHLASLMNGRGVVVASDGTRPPRQGLVLHFRRTPFRNITTRAWDGKHAPGRAASYDGVLVGPESTGIGRWRHDPARRWLVRPEDLRGLAEAQMEALGHAAAGVRPGGFLVYAVPTLTRDETTGVIDRFVERHQDFALDSFADPLEEGPNPGYRYVWPDEAGGGGLFVACLIRKGTPKRAPSKPKKVNPDPVD